MTTTGILLLAILALGFLITFQIAKASEYVSVLTGEKKAFEQSNKVNAFLMVVFLVVGLIGVWYCNEALYHKTLLPFPSASDHGENIDTMLKITLAVTGFVFFLTQILLFWFAYKYQHSEKREAFYYPHNTKLEIIWTTLPAITLCILVGFGLFYWFKITGDAPANSLQVEITGKQFGWIYRYPGKDKTFGKKYFRMIDEAKNNPLGMNWIDTAIEKRNNLNKVSGVVNIKADTYGFDDIVTTEALYVVKGEPVKLIINSRDVIHDVGLSHFRLKMDAVPGTPTTLWFTPLYTTAEMKEITKNPKFEYEISCDQMCGNGHYSMKGLIKVVSKEEFILWQAKQKAAYVTAFPEKDPANQQPQAKPAADSAQAAVGAAKQTVAVAGH